ncbi:hypothetical protein L218DRAFT_1006124 [Marasmius fiardii PR-910]|nr:hypothetical protein L218DRAFT_1006124 [Marasmius fiardii PR-910]
MKLQFLISLSALGSVQALINCAKCPPTIFYNGLTRSLTFSKEATSSSIGSTVQCNYDSPPISGISIYCLYQNSDGHVVVTNTGAGSGACPFPRMVMQSSCSPT